jgi:transcriptional regulator with XRE-family HTH domain
MTDVRDLHDAWVRDPDYRDAYEALGPSFDLARAMIEARSKAGLTQAKSVIARLESGRAQPSTKTLARLAAATGTRLRISFERADDAA